MLEKDRLRRDLQRNYYASTAEHYESLHVDPQDEHSFALSFLVGLIPSLDIRSILDVGSGTGRALRFIGSRAPGVVVSGIEPVDELREVAYRHGIAREALISGDGTSLQFKDGSFDLACEFGVLHHVSEPHKVIAEMLRVARKAIFVSDCNNWGQGSQATRVLKAFLRSIGLWRFAVWVKTSGKMYYLTPEDGLSYPYSVFDNIAQIRRHTKSVHILNTRDGDADILRSASHVALLALKE